MRGNHCCNWAYLECEQVYENTETKKTHIACDDYSVPSDIKHHIDYITPTIAFDAYVREPKKTRALRGRGFILTEATEAPPNITLPVSQVKEGPHVPMPPPAKDLQTQALTTCNQYITPECL